MFVFAPVNFRAYRGTDDEARVLVGLSERVAARRGVVHTDRMITVLERHTALERRTDLACTFRVTLIMGPEYALEDVFHIVEDQRWCSASA